MKRVKARVGFIPGQPGTPDIDLCILVDTLYAVCVEDPSTMTQDQFDDRIDGVLGNAIEVLENEISDFSQRQGLMGTTTEQPQTSGN